MQRADSERLSDQEIITRIREGRDLPLRVVQYLYTEKGGRGYYWVLKRSRNEDTAREILQEAISRLLIQIRKGKATHIQSLQAYLRESCKNLYLNYKHKKKPIEADMLEYADTVLEPSLPSDPMEQAERTDLIRQVLALLKEKCKKVLYWAVVEERTMDWIAEQLNLGSSQAAMTQKYRCKTSFVKLVAGKPAFQALVNQLLAER
ncbi:MAG: sigma-70 family RNA polymerase sigma factor [Bacteroidota bacterium]